jgi:hypothetical protein
MGDQRAAEAIDRHIGEGQQVIKQDMVMIIQVTAVVALEVRLGRRQDGTLGVVDQVENQTGIVPSVTQPIQQPQGFKAVFIDALAALIIYIFFYITWQ